VSTARPASLLLLALLVTLAAAVGPGVPPAQAAPPPLTKGQLAEARDLVALGNEAYNAGRFADALRLYENAYRLRPTSKILFNRAQCLRKLEAHERAATLYGEYLLREPEAPNRAEVERLQAELMRQAREAAERGNARVLAPLPVTPVAPPPDESRPRWYQRWYVWVGVGLVVGGVVAGAAAGASRSGGTVTPLPANDYGYRRFFGSSP
jgi:tetratricopeptide (TPR) repeat protein